MFCVVLYMISNALDFQKRNRWKDTILWRMIGDIGGVVMVQHMVQRLRLLIRAASVPPKETKPKKRNSALCSVVPHLFENPCSPSS
jgi:hypothetical protein